MRWQTFGDGWIRSSDRSDDLDEQVDPLHELGDLVVDVDGRSVRPGIHADSPHIYDSRHHTPITVTIKKQQHGGNTNEGHPDR